jgi:hypothetical protein
MRTRFTVNDSGVLVDRDGVELGRLVSLTIDTAGEFGKSGQSVGPTGLSLFEKSKEGNEDSPVGPTISNEVAEVWEVYDRLIGKGRRLYVDRTHGSMIRDAIKATGSVAIVKQAVIGLSRSPHHNGENEQKKTYLDLRYALKPMRGTGETIQERVEKMARYADGAESSVAGTRDRGVLEGRVDSAKASIRRLCEKAHRLQGPLSEEDLDLMSRLIAELKDIGIATNFRDTDGWPVFSDIDEVKA